MYPGRWPNAIRKQVKKDLEKVIITKPPTERHLVAKARLRQFVAEYKKTYCATDAAKKIFNCNGTASAASMGHYYLKKAIELNLLQEADFKFSKVNTVTKDPTNPGVYIIHSHNDWYKIGKVTRSSVSLRLKTLQIGNPIPLTLHKFFETKEPDVLEKVLHFKFQSSRGRGEWFELTEDDLQSITNLCEAADTVPQCHYTQ